MTEPFTLIDTFPSLRVLVVGEAMLDAYLEGEAPRLCREAPVPVVTLQHRTDAPGGAANAAVNLRALGASVTFVSVVGDDDAATAVRSALAAAGVSPSALITEPGRETLAKHRVVADGQLLVRFDQGDTRPLSRDSEARLIRRLSSMWAKHDAVLVSDYGYGIITNRIIRTVESLQAANPRVLLVDSRDLARYREVGATAVKPNFEEACELIGQRVPLAARTDVLAAMGDRFLDVTGARIAAVTLDSAGAVVFERGRVPYRTSAQAVRNAHVAGAGDTFMSAFGLALAAGATTPVAAGLASAAAAVAVTKDRTACCTADELRGQLLTETKVPENVPALLARVAAARAIGRRIVFTNGCFDILHSGHVSYLNRARRPGDLLIVGLNSDASVARLKGPTRPVNTLDDRTRVLAALTCVDFVIPFEEDTPDALIAAIRPDVFVKGGDYTEATLPEAPLVRALGGQVEILPFIEDRSTTGIIARIQGNEHGLPPEERQGGRGGTRLGERRAPVVRSAG